MEWITPKLASWASILDQQTRQQAIMTSSMPFVLPYLALMGDAHLGKGSTVGSVLPTVGAIMPAAVGVDIGCFSGDTRVPLLNGRQRSLKDLAGDGGTYWVYSLNASGRVVPGRATALKTRTNAELVRVTVSGGDEIICTPDHPFMLNDGTYREAKDLRFNESLMPLYRRWQTRDGYESVSTGKGTAQQTHLLVYEALNGPVPEDQLVHHRNHVHFDNEPGNLESVDKGEHSRHHRLSGHSFANNDPEFQALRVAGMRRSNAQPAMRAQKAVTATENITTYMANRPEHYAEAVAGNGARGAPFLAKFNVTPRDCDDCGDTLANPSALRWHKQHEHGYNHKVIAVEPLAERADVYCLQVEGYNNFALAAGVFVHNCGMAAWRTDVHRNALTELDLADLRRSIEHAIPLSMGNYNISISSNGTSRRIAELEALDGIESANSVAPNWHKQLGSLGSGNHFIECVFDEDGWIWLFLHSGSRGVGNKLAFKHIKMALFSCKTHSVKLPHPDLAYLTEGTPEFDAYIRDLRWAQRFAWLNRDEMMERVHVCFSDWLGDSFEVTETINTHHNYTEQETHFGQQVWLSRKGAIDATLGRPGLIPGSMATASYVVTGKGCEAAFNSSPHGAGRQYSRSKAKEHFTEKDLQVSMKGIEWRSDSGRTFLDEIPGAYKPISTVMEDSADLVEIQHELHQLVNVKGE